MYRYDEFDHQLVAERVEQFRGQVERRVNGELSEDAFKPLRLMNGVYLQLHAYMLRVAIPYGTLSSRQLSKLAHIAREYDRGYGHFTTRQNIQMRGVRCEDAADIIDGLHARGQTCFHSALDNVRNMVGSPLAGIDDQEMVDTRPFCAALNDLICLNKETGQRCVMAADPTRRPRVRPLLTVP